MWVYGVYCVCVCACIRVLKKEIEVFTKYLLCAAQNVEWNREKLLFAGSTTCHWHHTHFFLFSFVFLFSVLLGLRTLKIPYTADIIFPYRVTYYVWFFMLSFGFRCSTGFSLRGFFYYKIQFVIIIIHRNQ